MKIKTDSEKAKVRRTVSRVTSNDRLSSQCQGYIVGLDIYEFCKHGFPQSPGPCLYGHGVAICCQPDHPSLVLMNPSGKPTQRIGQG